MGEIGLGRQSSRRLFQRDGLALGRFLWDARRAGMRRESWIGRFPLIAIPLTAVRITQTGRAPVVADSCTAILYNPNQSYRAEQLLEDQPERTVWLVPDGQTLAACTQEFDDRLADDPTQPMPGHHAPIAPNTFAKLRWLVETLQDEQATSLSDSFAFHETAIELIDEIVTPTSRARVPANSRRARTVARQRDLAANARAFCLQHFADPLGLDDIAQAVGASRYHVCRLFRAFHGRSIHQYLTEIRLRASLDGVCDRKASLARVALNVGFNSQSHFTTAFVRYFGRTPAAYRRAI